MRQRIHLLWAVLLALVCAVAGAVGGFVLRGPSGAANPLASATANDTLSITAAGTLGTAFPQAARALANETPGVAAPLAAEHFLGSIAALDAISVNGQAYDVAGAADLRSIPSILEPRFASWEVLFATDPEVLAYDPSVPAFAGMDAANWAWKVASPGVLLGVANQSIDPNGYNGIFTLELQGLLENGSLAAVYDHFYSGAPGAYAQPNPSTTRVEPEASAATLLQTHVVQAFIIYRSYAIEHQLSYVTLDPHVNLGNLSASMISYYGQATTAILAGGGSGTVPVVGAPVAFSATVPSTATNGSLGELFVHLLLSPEGAAILEQNGFAPLVPGFADRPADLPPLLAPMVVPLPPALQTLVG